MLLASFEKHAGIDKSLSDLGSKLMETLNEHIE
jgi:hypothetical protein